MIYFYRVIGREPPLWDAGEAGWIVGAIADVAWLDPVRRILHRATRRCPGARGPRGGPKGVFAITRHPMMWGFAIWATVHLTVIGNAQGAGPRRRDHPARDWSGRLGQDRKKAKLMGEAWHEWTAQTAFIPFTRGVAYPGTVGARRRDVAVPDCDMAAPDAGRLLALDRLNALKRCQ